MNRQEGILPNGSSVIGLMENPTAGMERNVSINANFLETKR